MKRIVNPRVSLILALSVLFGILSYHEVLFGNWTVFIIFLVFVLAFVFFFLFKKRVKAIACCLVALLFFGIGFFDALAVRSSRGEQDNVYASGVIMGRVTDIGRNGELGNVIYLEDCTFDDKEIDGRVKVNTYDGSFYQSGDIIVAKGTLRNFYAVKDYVNTSAISNNVRFEFNEIESIEATRGSLTFAEKIRLFVYDVTQENMPMNADVAYALLTGDRNALDDETAEAFNSAGIMHLLVVSGLHIGFIITVFGFLLRPLRLKPLAELLILSLPMLFYAYICDFSPSVLRAVVMTACVYVARALFGRYDLLTSLCWAVSVILLVQPYYLFDVGFQLSATSIFGIATVYLQIDRFLKRKNLPKLLYRFCSSVAMSFSCVIATAFIVAYYFSGVVYLGIAVNLLAIPLVFVSFVSCFVGLLPGLFRYVLWLPDHSLQVVVEVARSAQGLHGSLSLPSTTVGIVVSLLLLFVVGGYVNLSKIPKRIFYSSGCVLLAFCVAVCYIPQRCVNGVNVFLGYNDTMFLATSENNEVAVVGAFCDKFVAQKVLDELDCKKTESVSIYFTDYKLAEREVVESFCNSANIAKVYKLNTGGNDIVSEYLAEKGIVPLLAEANKLTGNGVTVQPVFDGGLSAVVVKTGDITVAQVFSTGAKASRFAEQRRDIDYFVTEEAELFAEKGLPTISFCQQDFSSNFGANKYGNFTILEKDDRIILNFRRVCH